MDWLFAPPTIYDLIRVLKAWRIWLLATLAGALIGAALFYLAPPAYRARATVLVDFNLEQSWPEEPDRKLFYYLERETRKLIELSWSDSVMEAVSQASDIPIDELRNGVLILSQPGEGGWHFYADHPDPQTASRLASTWAQSFADQVEQVEMDNQQLELNQNIQVSVTQSASLPVQRRTPVSAFILAGSFAALLLSTLLGLFIHPKDTATGV
ncbi:MAG: hypothetical protein JXA13_01300 [Anaerolineales bacterium]|nr:hypothetical protein [Anaerolineales bacterium]